MQDDAFRADSREVVSGATRLHVETIDVPGGVPLVLLHGFPESSRAWDALAPRIAGLGYRVLAPDMRGYGRSDAPAGVGQYRLEALAEDVLAIMAAAGAERATLVGHDWGGIVAWAVAAWHPERVARLVVLNAPHLDVFGAVARRHPSQYVRSAYVGLFQLPALPERLLAARNFALLRRMLTGSARAGTFSRARLDAYAEDWARPGRLSGMLGYYRALMRHGSRPLGRVRPPVTIVWGRDDAALSFPLAEASLAQCNNGRLETLDASHWVHLEEPDAVLAAIGPAQPDGGPRAIPGAAIPRG